MATSVKRLKVIWVGKEDLRTKEKLDLMHKIWIKIRDLPSITFSHINPEDISEKEISAQLLESNIVATKAEIFDLNSADIVTKNKVNLYFLPEKNEKS